MRKNRIITYFFTAVLLVVAVCVWLVFTGENDRNLFFVRIYSNGEVEDIKYWKNEAEEYYVFLPSYADLSKAQILLNTDNTLSIGKKKLKDGMKCDFLDLDVPYVFSYSTFGKTYQHNITFVKSDKIAAMYIDTESGNMDYIHSEKGNEESGAINVYKSDGSLDYSGNLESINGRGNFTWTNCEKKSYSLKLSGESELLEMAKAQKWILLANADDSSGLRNKIVYDFADNAGLKFSPDSQFVDLYLNGEYAGLYLLCERNEVHSERVNISKQGSFLVSLEKNDRLKAQNYAHIITDSEQYLRVHYPLNSTSESLAALTEAWQSVENAIIAEDGIDPLTNKSWLELIDLDSWVRKYLIEEIFTNADACYISQFFYCDGNEAEKKIYAGPIWDFDHSIANVATWQLTYPNTMYANRLHVKDGYDTPWFYSLYQKEEFYNKVVEIYETEFIPLLNELCNEKIYTYAENISQAYKLNQIRWYNTLEDVFEQSEYISTFMSERINFLNSVWIDNVAYNFVKLDQGFGGFYAYIAVKSGEALITLPEFEDTPTSIFSGWYYADSGEPFDNTKTITENVEIYAKWQEKPEKNLKRIIKLVPVGVIFGMFVILCIVEVRKYRKERVTGYEK